MDPLLAGALFGAASSALVKTFDGPFKSLEDLWFANFGYKTALKRTEHEVKVEAFKKELLNELAKIPEENQQEPRLCVVGPALETAKYFVEENSLRQMFAKLVAAASDSTKINKAHPAFVNIISQLSPFEAKAIKEHNLLTMALPYCGVRFQDFTTPYDFTFANISNGHSIIEHFIIFDKINITTEEISLYSTILENIARLNLCELPEDYQLTTPSLYNKYLKIPALNHYLKDYKTVMYLQHNQTARGIYFIKRAVTPTSFGRLFFETCIQSN